MSDTTIAVLGALTLLLAPAACAEDEVTASTGTTATTEGSPDHTTGADTTSGAAETTGTDTTGTTGAEGATARASLILLDDLETPGLDELFHVDYADGALTELLRVSGAAADGITETSLSPSQTKLFYRAFDEATFNRVVEYIPLADGEAGASTPVAQPPAPKIGWLQIPTLFPDETRVAYVAADDTTFANRGLYLAEIAAEAVGVPEEVVPLPGQLVTSDVVPSESGDRLAYHAFADAGPTNVFMVPVSPLDTEATVQLSDLDQPWQDTSGAAFVPGEQALWYQADRDEDQLYEIFFVDLSGPTPAPPVKVNDPVPPDMRLSPITRSPDGSKLAWFVGANLLGDVYAVTFEGATVSAPVDVSSLGDMQVSSGHVTWSSDGRWLSYTAEHLQPGIPDLYVVDMGGPVPSDPMLVTAPGVLDGDGVRHWAFHPDADWLYVIASMEGEGAELYRCDLSTGVPGELQRVSGELEEPFTLLNSIVFSHDGTRVLYHSSQNPPAGTVLWVVDVAGATPGEARRVHPRLGAGEQHWAFARWSADDTAIVYQLDVGEAQPLYIVDADGMSEPTLVADDPAHVIVLDRVPQ